MRRLLWMGVGAAAAVIVAQQVRSAWHRYTPEGVAEQVEQAGQGAGAAGGSAVFLRAPTPPPTPAPPARATAPAPPPARIAEDEPLYDF